MNNPRQILHQQFDEDFLPISKRLDQAYAKSLRGLEKRLAQLEDDNLQEDSPSLRAFIADYEDSLEGLASLTQNLGGELQTSTLQLAPTLATQLSLLLAGLPLSDSPFTLPELVRLQSLIDYTTSPAWNRQFAILPRDLSFQLNAQIRALITQGATNKRIMAYVRGILRGNGQSTAYPLFRLQSTLRTLQMNVYRDSARVTSVVNAEIVSHQIRIAALDDRTCLACIDLHGSELAIGEKVHDHYNGRCIAIMVLKGYPIRLQRGGDWFNSLAPERQLRIAGQANYAALKAGAVTLNDFVEPYTDDVFGQQLRQASLVGILGEQARQYYS